MQKNRCKRSIIPGAKPVNEHEPYTASVGSVAPDCQPHLHHFVRFSENWCLTFPISVSKLKDRIESSVLFRTTKSSTTTSKQNRFGERQFSPWRPGNRLESYRWLALNQVMAKDASFRWKSHSERNDSVLQAFFFILVILLAVILSCMGALLAVLVLVFWIFWIYCLNVLELLLINSTVLICLDTM